MKRPTLTGMAGLANEGGRSTPKVEDTRCGSPSGAGRQGCGGRGRHAGSHQGCSLHADHPQGLHSHRVLLWGCLGAACMPGPMSLALSSSWPEMAARVPCRRAAPSQTGPGAEGGYSLMGCWPTVELNRAGQGRNSYGPHWPHEEQQGQGSRSG